MLVINEGAFMLYAWLRKNAQKGLKVEIGRKELARQTGLSMRTLQRRINDLKEKGLVTHVSPGGLTIRLPTYMQGEDLKGADLSGLDLRGYDFRGANLTAANLTGSDLRGAIFTDADLSGADLSGADLRKSDALRAKFHGTKLQGSRLRKANLVQAQLFESDLTNADITACLLYAAQMESTITKGTRVSGHFEGEEHWGGIRLRNVDPFGFGECQNNHVLFALIVRELLPTQRGRMGAARIESIMFGCYQQIIEDWLVFLPEEFVQVHQRLDDRYADGSLDWNLYFKFKKETAIVFERIKGNGRDPLLQALIDNATDRTLRLALKADLSMIAAQGYSGLGIAPDELNSLTGGVWTAASWDKSRSEFQPSAAPDLSPGDRSIALGALHLINGLSAEELIQIMQDNGVAAPELRPAERPALASHPAPSGQSQLREPEVIGVTSMARGAGSQSKV